MFARLSHFKNNKKLYSAFTACLILLICILVPVIRVSVLDVLRHPLNLFNLAGREIHGIIFYHHNYIQNEQLAKEAGLLRQELNNKDELLEENKRLHELLQLKQNIPFKVITAKVIGRAPENRSSLAIISKGTRNGIRSGMVVLSYAGLAGRVVETSTYAAKVMLVNDPEFAVSGIVKRSRQEGLVCGTLANSLVMKYLPAEADIKISDIIITSGMNEVYPKGLLIGTVVDVAEDFSGLVPYAIIKPAVELSNIEEVLIIVQ